MEKLLTYPGRIGNDIFMYAIDQEHGHLTKTASQYHPEIAAYINSAKKIPGKTQLLLTALGAGEFWGPNVNGDYFPENELAYPGPEYGYKTFESMANVFKHHQNKPTDPKYGNVVLSVYNPTYHRVELIVAVDNKSGADIVAKMENGDYPEWSMGCRVKYDVCSVCKNQAKNRTQYCSHVKYYIGRIDPETGKHVYVINPKPKFFDISYVLIGADKTAKTHLKVARQLHQSHTPVMGSAEIAEKRAADKVADMKKEVPAHPGEGASSLEELKAIEEMKAREEDLPTDLLDNLASNSQVSKLLSTLMMLGIQPKPHEVQRIVIVNAGHKDLADELEEKRICFDPDEELVPSRTFRDMISRKNFDDSLAKSLYQFLPQRSIYEPHCTKRILVMMQNMPEPAAPMRFIKVGSAFNPEAKKRKKEEYSLTKAMGLMAVAAMLHRALSGKEALETLTGLPKLIVDNPGFAAATTLGGAAVLNQLIQPSNREHFEENRFKMENEVPAMDNGSFAFAKRAFVTGTGPTGAMTRGAAGIGLARLYSSGLNKAYRTDPEYREGSIKRFMRKNPEAMQALAAFDALQGLGGGGTTGLIRKAKQMASPVLRRFTKMAEAQNAQIEKHASENSSNTTKDLLSSTLVWPLAFGRKGAPVRMIGGLIDQGAMALAGKMGQKKKKNQP